MWKKFLNLGKDFFLSTLFPQSCLGCARESSIICQDCLALVEINQYHYCPFCKSPKRVFEKGLFVNSPRRVNDDPTEISERFQYKGKCNQHRNMPLDGLFSAASYQDQLVKKLIANFKYKPYLKILAVPLASLIISHFLASENKEIFQPVENSFFIPVPLTKQKQKKRGFNQSALLAEELSRFFKVPCQFNNLIKIKKTQPQVELKRGERMKNIQGAFFVRNPQALRRKRIFLVDDVFTTGSTMEQAALMLKKAGAKEVWGIVVAREPLSN